MAANSTNSGFFAIAACKGIRQIGAILHTKGSPHETEIIVR